MVEEIPWEGRCLDAATVFAESCRQLKKENPYPEIDALQNIASALVTELWDRFFSQTEIRSAFEEALASLPRYAAGEDRRGDKR
ncbi:MAG: hypothetical protein WDM89_16690 [Rhizomicrobium sp.]